MGEVSTKVDMTDVKVWEGETTLGSYFENELFQSLILNRFILYSHDFHNTRTSFKNVKRFETLETPKFRELPQSPLSIVDNF